MKDHNRTQDGYCGLVSLREVSEYFSCPEPQAREVSDTFIKRLLETGFDDSITPTMRNWLIFWALANDFETAVHATDQINEILSTS